MNTMKALTLYGIGDLRYEDVEIPGFNDDEVLVKVKCAGICGSDVGRVYKTGTYHFPTIPGHEFSGEVVASSKKEEIGKRVCVFPLLPCFQCESCHQEQYATCSNYDYYGSRRDGGFAEYIAIKRWNLVELPDNVSFEEAAMCEPASVARHASLKIMDDSIKSVLISGAGPIGLIAAQWCKAMGAKQIYMFDIDARKIEFAKTMGICEYTDDVKVDAVIEGTGVSQAIVRCLAGLKSGGKIVLMGNPSGEISLTKEEYWYILRKELKLFGTWNSCYSYKQNDWVESIKAVSSGKLNLKPLITHTFDFCEFEKAFDMMKNKTEFYNKVMFVVE